MSRRAEREGAGRVSGLLRRADQACVAAIVACSLLAMLASWLYRGGHRDRLVNIERAEPRTVQFQLDINQADWPEWVLLPGIGEMLARRIVESRERDGPFAGHRDLLRVKGIGPKTLEEIRPYLLPVPAPGAAVETDQEPPVFRQHQEPAHGCRSTATVRLSQTRAPLVNAIGAWARGAESARNSRRAMIMTSRGVLDLAMKPVKGLTRLRGSWTKFEESSGWMIDKA